MKAMKRTPLPKSHWSDDEIAILTARFPRERIAAIARDLGRSREATAHKAERIGLIRRRPWADAEHQQLMALWGNTKIKIIADRLGRTCGAVYSQAELLGLKCDGPAPGSQSLNDLIGKRFGRLRVIRLVGRTAHGQALWECFCDCGSVKNIARCDLKNGFTRSCGCLAAETLAKASEAAVKHGATRKGKELPEYRTWSGIITRCENPKSRAWKLYGGAGVTICKRWRSDFAAFFVDMGPRPSSKHSIDRHPDPNGNYEPGNCRWATPREQALNLRCTIRYTYRGITGAPSELAEHFGILRGRLTERLRRGWPIERALTQPVVRNQTKITDAQVNELRHLALAEKRSSADLAKRYGITSVYARSIIRGSARRVRDARVIPVERHTA